MVLAKFSGRTNKARSVGKDNAGDCAAVIHEVRRAGCTTAAQGCTVSGVLDSLGGLKACRFTGKGGSALGMAIKPYKRGSTGGGKTCGANCIITGDTIAFKNILNAEENSGVVGYADGAYTPVAVAASAVPDVPVVTLAGATEKLSMCTGLPLDAGDSKGDGGRPMLYKWTVEAPADNECLDAGQDAKATSTMVDALNVELAAWLEPRCFGSRDADGGACELNGDSSACAVATGKCRYVAAPTSGGDAAANGWTEVMKLPDSFMSHQTNYGGKCFKITVCAKVIAPASHTPARRARRGRGVHQCTLYPAMYLGSINAP